MPKHTANTLGSKLPLFSILAVLWTLAVLLGTLTPADALPNIGHSISDKLIHAFIFFMLALLVKLAVMKDNLQILRKVKDVHILLFAALLGAGTELGQSVVPGRYMDIRDLVANLAGILLALFLLYIVRKKTSG